MESRNRVVSPKSPVIVLGGWDITRGLTLCQDIEEGWGRKSPLEHNVLLLQRVEGAQSGHGMMITGAITVLKGHLPFSF